MNQTETECRDKLYDALCVIIEDTVIRKVIEAIDPQAYQQATHAVALENIRKTMKEIKE